MDFTFLNSNATTDPPKKVYEVTRGILKLNDNILKRRNEFCILITAEVGNRREKFAFSIHL